MKSISISLPTFDGFYESLWENSDSLINEMRYFEQEHNEHEFVWQHLDDWDISKEYRTDVAKAYCELYAEHLHDLLGLEVTLEFETIYSPKYYNYETDKIYAYIKWEDDYKLHLELLKLIGKHKQKVEDFIYKYHTSYDGFVSFMDNALQDWIERTKAIGYNYQENEDNIYLSHLLAYLLLCEAGCQALHEFDCEMMLEVYENVSMSCYLEPTTPKAKAELERYNKMIEYDNKYQQNENNTESNL